MQTFVLSFLPYGIGRWGKKERIFNLETNNFYEQSLEFGSKSSLCDGEKTNEKEEFKSEVDEMEVNSEGKVEMMEKIKDVEKDLPETLKKVINPFETSEEKLMVLTATIAETGALMPGVWFNYDGKKTYPMLMVMVIAPPASGKGVLSYPKQLLSLINRELRENREKLMEDYKVKVKEIKSHNKQNSQGKLPLPKLPVAPLLIIPGNVTQAALIQQLNANGPENPFVIFEQEADAFGLMAKMGGYSFGNTTILRSLFHSEDVSQLRKTDNEFLYAENLKGVVIFSGTESQVSTIINSNKDGLFSRFLFLSIKGTPGFRDVFKRSGKPLEVYFHEIAPEFYSIWKYFSGKSIEVTFTAYQKTRINNFGKKHYPNTHNFISDYADSITKRHANILARIAAILRMFRYYEQGDMRQTVVCTDEDVSIALWIAELSIQNALELFKRLPGEKISPTNTKKNSFWKELPPHFKTSDIGELQRSFEIPDRTLFNWFTDFVTTGLLERIMKGEYRKTPMAEVAVAE